MARQRTWIQDRANKRIGAELTEAIESSWRLSRTLTLRGVRALLEERWAVEKDQAVRACLREPRGEALDTAYADRLE